MAPDSLAVQKRRGECAKALYDWLARLTWTLRAVTNAEDTTYPHSAEREREAMNMTILKYAGLDALLECERGRK